MDEENENGMENDSGEKKWKIETNLKKAADQKES